MSRFTRSSSLNESKSSVNSRPSKRRHSRPLTESIAEVSSQENGVFSSSSSGQSNSKGQIRKATTTTSCPPAPFTESSKLEREYYQFIQEASTNVQIYQHLQRRWREQKLFLPRTLTYVCKLRQNQHKNKRRTLHDAVEFLRTNAGLSDVCQSYIFPDSKIVSKMSFTVDPTSLESLPPLRITLRGLYDATNETQWQTMSSHVSVMLCHRWSNHRKRTSGLFYQFLCENVPLSCLRHTSGEDSLPTICEDVIVHLPMNDLLRETINARTTDSTLCMFIRGLEARKFTKLYDVDDRRLASRKLERFPVFYKLFLPLTMQPTANGQWQCSLQPGEYGMRVSVDDFADNQTVIHNAAASGLSPTFGHWFQSQHLPKPEKEINAELDAFPQLVFEVSTCHAPSLSNVAAKCSMESQILHMGKMPVQSKISKSNGIAQSNGHHHQHYQSNESKHNRTIVVDSSRVISICYSFYSGGQMQQSAQTRSFCCPFCDSNFAIPVTSTSWAGQTFHSVVKIQLDALLLHLRTVHFRFCFQALRSNNSQEFTASSILQVNICVCQHSVHSENDAGMRHGAVFNDKLKLTRWYPERRSPGVYLNFHKSSREKMRCHLISHGQCDECLAFAGAPAVGVSYPNLSSEHHRQYFHTWSSLPIPCNQDVVDSEEDEAQPWLMTQYYRNVEEFTDVNEGEKVVMQAWNQFLLGRPYFGDCRIYAQLQIFVRQFAEYFHRIGARANLLLHFNNLLDYGLIAPKECLHLMCLYESIVNELHA